MDESIFLSNLSSFINDVIIRKFRKTHKKTFDKLMILKEDKE